MAPGEKEKACWGNLVGGFVGNVFMCFLVLFLFWDVLGSRRILVELKL